ncbi:two-component regulator propeller domain-containing protein [Flavobacterium sp.]|uniref:type IX secretion system anionic LPS delivery protein PorZ n=1 Tax=Flavobacterium sp. TaxID=239 RepID=UPI0037536953
MKNTFLKSILILSTLFGYSQSSQLWKGYFSYNNIQDVSESVNNVYAASENAYFKKNLNTNEISTTSTVEGLSGQAITQIYHSEIYKKTFIGHVDGLIIIVNDADGAVLNVVDIINKQSVPPNKKKINHFMEYNGKIYIATDFGISLYDLNISAFGDTYFIGSGGSNIEILQTTLFNGFIYAVAKGYGILTANIANTNLIDFNQWIIFASGSWVSVEKTAIELSAINASNVLYKFVGNTPTIVTSLPQTYLDHRYNNGNLIVTTPNYVIIYDDNITETLRINNTSDLTTTFTSGTKIGNTIYIGTKEKGLISSSISNPSVFINSTPNGPEKNKIFSIKTFSTGIWAVYGDYSDEYNPYNPILSNRPISKYDGAQKAWITFPYTSLFDAKSISRILVNPNNENQVFFSSYYSGLLKFENSTPSAIFNTSNSSLQGIVGQAAPDIRVNGAAFDKEGNIWMTNSLVSKSLHVLKNNGQWQGYTISAIPNPLINSYGRIAIDKNGTKWIGTYRTGLIAFNEKYNNKSLEIDDVSGNLPSSDVRAVAVDNKNKLWIGTDSGLRILQNVDSFITQNSLTTNSIIILEGDLAQELLFQQSITDIVVDGANNKWIGTNSAGVFYISSDGQETFNIFTKENSPLPSNVINDIDINEVTGEVFIATENGMVSFKGTATKSAENLSNVVVYPNPVRPEYQGFIAVTGLMNKCNVKIADIEGNLVHEAISEGGTILWDTKAFGKYNVASGVYMVFVSSDDGTETKVKKVMIVR